MNVAASPRPLTTSLLKPLCPAIREVQRAPKVAQAGQQLLGAVVDSLKRELSTSFECRTRLMAPSLRSIRNVKGKTQLLLSLSNSGHRALLEIEEGFAAALVDRLAGNPVAPIAPAPLSPAEAAGLSFLALCALRSARSAKLIEEAFAPRFAGIAADSIEAAQFGGAVVEWVAIDLDLRLADLEGEGRLLIPAGDLASVCRQHRTPCSDPLAASVAAARLSGALYVGQTELAQEELSRLTPGDAVVLANLERLDGKLAGAARFCFPGFELHGSVSGAAFTLSHHQLRQPLESAMSEPTRPPPLPVEIEIELARLSLPLAELGQLRAGSLLDLNVRLDQPVLVRVGDKAVARAELVDVGGEVAARILELLD